MLLGSLYEKVLESLTSREEISKKKVNKFMVTLFLFYIFTVVFFFFIINLLMLPSVLFIVVAGLTGFGLYNYIIIMSDPDIFIKKYKKSRVLFTLLSISYLIIGVGVLYLETSF